MKEFTRKGIQGATRVTSIMRPAAASGEKLTSFHRTIASRAGHGIFQKTPSDIRHFSPPFAVSIRISNSTGWNIACHEIILISTHHFLFLVQELSSTSRWQAAVSSTALNLGGFIMAGRYGKTSHGVHYKADGLLYKQLKERFMHDSARPADLVSRA